MELYSNYSFKSTRIPTNKTYNGFNNEFSHYPNSLNEDTFTSNKPKEKESKWRKFCHFAASPLGNITTGSIIMGSALYMGFAAAPLTFGLLALSGGLYLATGAIKMLNK